MKGIRNKIIISFTLLISTIVVAIIGVITWQSGKRINQQSVTLGEELTSQVYKVVDGHNAIALTLLDTMKRDVVLHLDTVTSNPAIISSIEKDQEKSLLTIIKKAASSGAVDYATMYDLKGNLVVAYPAALNSSKLPQYNSTFPLYKKGQALVAGKKAATIDPVIVKHGDNFFDLHGITAKIAGSTALSVSAAAAVWNDFGEPIGFYIAGKILNGYTAPFESLYLAGGASTVLYEGARAITFAGFSAKIDNSAGMDLNPEELAPIYKNNNNLRRILTLAGEKYLSTCSALSDGDKTTVGVLCTGQPEARIATIRTKLEAVGALATQSLQTWIGGVGAIAFLLFIVVAFLITRSIVTPLQKIVQVLSDSSEELRTASLQLAAANQGLSEGAAGQSASLEETSSALHEIATMIHHSGGNTDQAKIHMDKVSETVGKTKQSMDEVHNSMVGISKSSEETSKIIKTIDEIAFQTNLLALNAAVEAARAGESGAGFAVVADEVRSLALRSTEAAKNTASLLQESIAKVKSGTILVDATTSDFQSVAESITTVAQLIGEVASSAEQQSHAITQISEAVNDISSITMSNTSHTEESAAISQNFTEQADRLNEIVLTLGKMIDSNANRQPAPPLCRPQPPPASQQRLPAKTRRS